MIAPVRTLNDLLPPELEAQDYFAQAQAVAVLLEIALLKDDRLSKSVAVNACNLISDSIEMGWARVMSSKAREARS